MLFGFEYPLVRFTGGGRVRPPPLHRPHFRLELEQRLDGGGGDHALVGDQPPPVGGAIEGEDEPIG